MTESDIKKQLIKYLDAMSKTGQLALLDYAKFMANEHPAEQLPQQDPVDIKRPEEETVVAAIRRLTNTYPMLDRQQLLHETSNFMMQHMMQGRDAVVVIDDLEVYFREQYQAYAERQS